MTAVLAAAGMGLATVVPAAGRIRDRQAHGGLVYQGGTSPRHNNAKGYAALSLLRQVECWYDA